MLYSKAIAMTALSDLKPTQKFLVMNLLADAGFDVSDWANYDGEHPASNPKYCYNWSFEQPGEMFALPGNGMTLGGRELGSQAIPNREFEKPPARPDVVCSRHLDIGLPPHARRARGRDCWLIILVARYWRAAIGERDSIRWKGRESSSRQIPFVCKIRVALG
jgi:hypothetical protein